MEWDDQAKMNCTWKDWHQSFQSATHVQQPMLCFFFLKSALYPACTIPLSQKNTISQLKLFCHLVLCLKLIPFTWKRNQTQKKESWVKTERSEEERQCMENTHNSLLKNTHEDWKQTCGRTGVGVCITFLPLYICFQFIMHHNHITIMERSLPMEPKPYYR